MNDQTIKTGQDLKQMIKAKKIGDKVTLTILRQGKSKTGQVTLGEMP